MLKMTQDPQHLPAQPRRKGGQKSVINQLAIIQIRRKLITMMIGILVHLERRKISKRGKPINKHQKMRTERKPMKLRTKNPSK